MAVGRGDVAELINARQGQASRVLTRNKAFEERDAAPGDDGSKGALIAATRRTIAATPAAAVTATTLGPVRSCGLRCYWLDCARNPTSASESDRANCCEDDCPCVSLGR